MEVRPRAPLAIGCGQDKIRIPPTVCRVPDALPPACSSISPPRHDLDASPFSPLFLGLNHQLFPTPQFHTQLPSARSLTPPRSSHGWLPSSHKSSLNVTSSERLSVAICICQGAGGKQWHTCMRIIQGGLIKGLFYKGMEQDKGSPQGTEQKQPWARRMKEQDNGCSQPRVILHREARRGNTPTAPPSSPPHFLLEMPLAKFASTPTRNWAHHPT